MWLLVFLPIIQASLVRDMRSTETSKLVVEMQEILDKVMSKMEREAHPRPINLQGVFNYEDDEDDYGYYEDPLEGKKEEQMTFSMLMNMKKTKKPNIIEKDKHTTFRNRPKHEKETTSRVKFATDKQLTVDPVISQMMRNIDLYQRFSHGKLLGETEEYFKREYFNPVIFQNVK